MSESANETIKVSIRLRPSNRIESKRQGGAPFELNKNSNEVSLNADYCDKMKKQSYSAQYDSVVQGESNLEIYQTNLRPIVLATLEGYNGTIFAYGQTSSGKTYTMMGNEVEPGVIPQAVDEVFNYIKQKADKEYLLRVTYVEIYNETLKDLLSPSKIELRILEDKVRGVFINNLKEEIVTTPKQVMKIIERGELNRHVASNDYNLFSSRSHTIFQFIIESRELNADKVKSKFSFSPLTNFKKVKEIRFSLLNLIDLAGSEKDPSNFDRKKESAYINKSLLTLGTVIAKISEGSQGHIPYRDSKLTRILQTSLTGYCKIGVVCNINPYGLQVEESINTLRFASRLKKIQTKSKKIMLVEDKALIQRYKKEIEELKEKLTNANQEVEKARNHESYFDDSSRTTLKERIDHLTNLILTPTTLKDKIYKRSRPMSVFHSSTNSINVSELKLPLVPETVNRKDNNERMKKLLSDLRFKNRYIEELEKNLDTITSNPLNTGNKDIVQSFHNMKRMKESWDISLLESLKCNTDNEIGSKVTSTLKKVASFRSSRISILESPFQSLDNISLSSGGPDEALRKLSNGSVDMDSKGSQKSETDINRNKLHRKSISPSFKSPELDPEVKQKLEDFAEMESLMNEQNRIIVELEDDRKLQNQEIISLKDMVKKLELNLFDYHNEKYQIGMNNMDLNLGIRMGDIQE